MVTFNHYLCRKCVLVKVLSKGTFITVNHIESYGEVYRHTMISHCISHELVKIFSRDYYISVLSMNHGVVRWHGHLFQHHNQFQFTFMEIVHW